MSTARKVVFSFLFSAVLCAGIALFAFTGIFVSAVLILILAAVFLTLFLTIFFCFNVRQNLWFGYSAGEAQTFVETAGLKPGKNKLIINNYENEELEELEAAEDTLSIDGVPKPNTRIAFGDDDIPYLVESVGFELVDEGILDNESNEDAAELELVSIGAGGSMFRQPFAFSLDNPELLQGVTYEARRETYREVLYEKDGIHYINNNVFNGDKDMGKTLNDNFAKLVESVVGNR